MVLCAEYFPRTRLIMWTHHLKVSSGWLVVGLRMSDQNPSLTVNREKSRHQSRRIAMQHSMRGVSDYFMVMWFPLSRLHFITKYKMGFFISYPLLSDKSPLGSKTHLSMSLALKYSTSRLPVPSAPRRASINCNVFDNVLKRLEILKCTEVRTRAISYGIIFMGYTYYLREIRPILMGARALSSTAQKCGLGLFVTVGNKLGLHSHKNTVP